MMLVMMGLLIVFSRSWPFWLPTALRGLTQLPRKGTATNRGE